MMKITKKIINITIKSEYTNPKTKKFRSCFFYRRLPKARREEAVSSFKSTKEPVQLSESALQQTRDKQLPASKEQLDKQRSDNNGSNWSLPSDQQTSP